MEFRLLGPLGVLADGRPLPLGPPQQRALLAVLALRAGEVVGVDTLIDAIWQDRPPDSALNIVHGYVAALRGVLEPDRRRGEPATVLRTRPPGYLLALRPDQTDAARFASLVDTARRSGDARTVAAAAREALALWRGDVLGDIGELPAVEAERVRLNGLRRHALDLRIDADLALGRHAELVPELQGLVAADPLAEGLRGHLMRALYRSGRQADALEAFAAGRQVLADELGVEPGPELRALQHAVLTHDPALTPRPSPMHAALPAAVSSFVGRAAEVVEVGERIAGNRLVTLTGPGGIGKTRLALEVGRAAEFPGGVWLVDLVPADRPVGVLAAVAAALGVRAEPGRPLADAVHGRLRGDRSLLLLDNCDHVVEACADLVTTLLRACPRLHVLVTSREALGMLGETVWPVPAMRPADAVELFAGRAGRAFRLTADVAQVVAGICARLDGLPLAIELAAARTSVLSVDELAARLDDRLRLLTAGNRGGPARHRTLAEVIDWSYRLLSPAGRALFERLSVFTAGFDLAAAEAVGEADSDVAVLLGRLVDKSLVQRGEGVGGRSRYRLLESLRHFAHDRLREHGGTARARLRHAAHFAAVAEQLSPLIAGQAPQRWLDRLDEDRAELRSAAATAFHGAGEPAADPALGVRLVAAAWMLWNLRGPLGECRDLTEIALRHTDAEPPRTRAQLLYGAAASAFGDGDLARAAQAGRACLELAETHGDDLAAGWGLGMLGLAAWAAGDYTEGRQYTELAVAASRRADDAWSVAIGLTQLGRLASDRGDLADAATLLDESVLAAEAGAEPQAIGFALDLRATLALRQGDDDQAAALAERALAAYRPADLHEGVASALRTIAEAATRRADPRRAATAHLERMELCRRHGYRGALAACLEDVADVAARNDRHMLAVRLMAAADALRSAHGTPVPTAEHPQHDNRVAVVRAELHAADFAAAWRAGQQHDLDQTLTEARDLLTWAIT
jgi:predicted ATPase/DNA-binding SARP family transcriptional activator